MYGLCFAFLLFIYMSQSVYFLVLFFFYDTATTEIYTYLHTLSLHDALPISSRFDITCLLEKGEDIPILFSTRNRLEVWANSLSLELSPLYGKAGSNAVRVAGEFPFRKHSATLWVDFVWVSARWSRYRQALVKRSRASGEDTLSAKITENLIVARRKT